LSLHPFPQIAPQNSSLQKQWSKYRENIISKAGICIFIFGNKEENGKTIIAEGMIEEYNIAKKMNKLIIPVGGTGGASKKIYDDMYNHSKNYPYLSNYWDVLKTDKPKDLQEAILSIITEANII